MPLEEAFNVLEQVLDQQPLSAIQKLVFRGAWENQSYMDIATNSGYDYGYIKDTGYELWRYLSTVLEQKVTKQNVQHVFKRLAEQSNRTYYIQSNPQIKNLGPSEHLSLDSANFLEDHEIRWVGREVVIEKLIQNLCANNRILSLVGITGVGKSALAIRLILDSRIAQIWHSNQVIRFDTEQQTFERFAKQILGDQFPKTPTQTTNPQELVEQILDRLQTQPCLLILDMVENVLTVDDFGNNRFHDPAFALFFEHLIQAEDSPSRLILTSQAQVPVIAEGRYQTRSHTEHLKGLAPGESLQLFAAWDIVPTNNIEIEYLQRIIQVYQGHPLALQIIAAEILDFPYHKNISAYWQDYGCEIMAAEQKKQTPTIASQSQQITLAYYSLNLSDLVRSRIEHTLQRLKVSAPLAYLLLCMGAVYRCPVERAAWLTLIADTPREAQLLAFQTLQRRFLLEVDRDRATGQVTYYLHSLIHSVALQHLSMLDSEKEF